MSKTFVGWPTFPKASAPMVMDDQLRNNVRNATHTIRGKRAKLVAERPDWQDLRDSAEAIKNQVLFNLDTYLEQIEEKVTAAGGKVHWAKDAAEANEIITGLVKATGEKEVIKVKSMLTEEIELENALAEIGVLAHETDLAATIIQQGDDLPSHVVVPALHKNRKEIKEIFLNNMGKYGLPALENLTDDPEDLAEASRRHLREKFLESKVAISGANFIVAETGTLVIVESEGNGRMCLTLPETLISVVGIEKVLPNWQDLEVFLQMLARNATGERMAPYTSMWTGVTPGDGPQDFHLVLVDNGRTRALSDEVGRQALRCIRCGACMNICPVYERTSGLAYGSVYPGPIGAILNPLLRGIDNDQTASLPYASTLCGACNEVCPVKIRFTDVLLKLRNDVAEGKNHDPHVHSHPMEKTEFKALGEAMEHPSMWKFLVDLAGKMGVVIPKRIKLPGMLGGWTKSRLFPHFARHSFRHWWKKNKGGK